MAKVMNLVDPRILERLTSMEPVNPLHQTISSLDREMQAILQRGDLADRDKVGEYNRVLQRYLEYQDHHRIPTVQTAPASTTPSPDVEGDILRTVPKNLRQKAEAIMERIKRHPDMSWNERGEFVDRGRVLSGSNVVDLINDVLRHRKTFSPHGWQDFARALRQTNIPQDMIGHRQRWDWMHRNSATSDAFSTAEEQSPTPTRSRSLSRSIPRPRKSKRILKWDNIYKK